ncbi:F-box domain containing protein [Trema orientale]|uniref:F-box domain containing protein n=1 Tax=Trema orientale TaxID=63057 RepID=A0A2P5FAM9_TREOI|nr:F-box domain containing protein [Trema orientale]
MEHQENQVEQFHDHDITMSYFSALPEELISLILSKTSARDACRFSAVSSQFRSATESDLVWEKFLPSNYSEIISRCDSTFASKKHFYLSVFQSTIYLDNDTKVRRITQVEKCFMGCNPKASM